MLGVATAIAEQQRRKTGFEGELGILSLDECTKFMTAYKYLQDLDYRLFNFIHSHIDLEVRFEKTR